MRRVGLNDVWRWTKRGILMSVFMIWAVLVIRELYYRAVEHYIMVYVPEFDMYYKCSWHIRKDEDHIYMSMSRDPSYLKHSHTPPDDEMDYVYVHRGYLSQWAVFYMTPQMDTLSTFSCQHHSRTIPMLRPYEEIEGKWGLHKLARQYPCIEIEYHQEYESIVFSHTKDISIEYAGKKHFRKKGLRQHLLDPPTDEKIDYYSSFLKSSRKPVGDSGHIF